jgi:PAS domain S-box-containing protein
MLTEVLNPTGYFVSSHSIGPWVVGMLIAALGIAALFRERGSTVSLALCTLAMSVSVWLLSSGILYSALDEPRALFWAKAAHLGVVFIPSTVFIFTLTIVQRLREFRVVAWGSLAVSGVFYISILATDRFISGLYRYRWGYYSHYGPLSVPFLVFFACLLLVSLMFLRAELARSSPGVPQQRVRALLIALGVGYLGAVDYLATYGIPIYPFGYVPILGFAVLMFGAVWRYRLLEITPALAAEQIIDTMADALLVLDQDGIVRVANQAASQLFGYAREEFVGKPVNAALGDLLGPDKTDALTGAGITREYETHHRTREDKILALGITGSVTRDRSGDPIAFVFVIRDLTERKQLEEQLRQAQRLEALGHLAGEIAHELEIIVTVISGHGALLPTGLEDSRGTRTPVEEMKKAADRAAELTRQLLAFSSSQRVKPALLDLNVLITNLRGVLEWVVGKDIGLTTVLDPALGWVMADQGQIEQVIIKLAANAREAMSDGARLAIETANVRVTPFSPPPHGRVHAGKYVMLAVNASGWLMDEDTRSRLFEPSFARKAGRVTWLDLAMVYGIVKQSGGHIEVTSDREVGTTFRIYLPLMGPGDSGRPYPEVLAGVEDRRPQAGVTSRA